MLKPRSPGFHYLVQEGHSSLALRPWHRRRQTRLAHGYPAGPALMSPRLQLIVGQRLKELRPEFKSLILIQTEWPSLWRGLNRNQTNHRLLAAGDDNLF